MKYLFILTSLLFSMSVSAQINKGQWLVGGNITGMYQKESGSDYTSTQIQLPLNVGYFVGTGIALGLRGQGSYEKESYTVTNSYFYQPKVTAITQQYTYGPFLRAYLLPQKSMFNLFIDVQYAFGYSELRSEVIYSGATNTNVSSEKVQNYNISLAPVLFLNKNVSLEFILAYDRSLLMESDIHSDSFLFGTGLQIHLGKGRNLKTEAVK